MLRRNAHEFMNAHRRYMAAKEALRRYAKMLTAQFVDRREPLEYGDPPIERVEGPKAEVMMIIWGECLSVTSKLMLILGK